MTSGAVEQVQGMNMVMTRVHVAKRLNVCYTTQTLVMIWQMSSLLARVHRIIQHCSTSRGASRLEGKEPAVPLA
jgi:hypothetical protein